MEQVPSLENEEHLKSLVRDALEREILRYQEHVEALKTEGEKMKPEAREAQLRSCEEDIELLREAIKRHE